jgi:hypothetical protein
MTCRGNHHPEGLTSPTLSHGERLRPGDLLFQDGSAGDPFSRAVRNVTTGAGGAGFAHVGLFAVMDGKEFALEALPEAGVVATPLGAFFTRCRPGESRPPLAGRLKKRWRHLAGPAVSRAASQIGKPYNAIFDPEGPGYYCAELIYDAFRAANAGWPLFERQPMTFKDPRTGETCPLWAAYFEWLGVSVPEGRPGLNPGNLSLSDKIEILNPSLPRSRPLPWDNSRQLEAWSFP